MSIEAINEAIELLRIAQNNMGPDPGYLDRYDRHHWDRISRCRQELEKLRQQEPAAFAILSDSGNAVRIWWSGAERERAERIAAEDFPGMHLVALSAAPVPAAVPEQTRAAADVLAERRRQVESEGWTPEHDDEHANGELASAAACYALNSAMPMPNLLPPYWPWARAWWKPTDPRRDLVKAGALVLAEIERLDQCRAAIDGAVQKGAE